MKSTMRQGGFVVSRRFDAPRDLVWRVLTEPEHLAHWWGQEGCKTEVVEFDLRPGGVSRYRLRNARGEDTWGMWEYREVSAPERLVFVASFQDEAGESVEMLTTVTLSERRGGTVLTNRSVAIGSRERARVAA